MILRKYDDPGHGWLKCPRLILTRLNLIDKVSSYSYQRGDYVYLEEDCDMGLLFDALKAEGQPLTWRTYTGNRCSKIRNYDCFSPT